MQLVGALGISRATQIHALLADFVGAGGGDVDCSAITAVDMSILQLFVAWRRAAHVAAVELSFVKVPTVLDDALALAGLRPHLLQSRAAP
jgi:anti-anti-sigma regulatory factor